MDQYPLGIYDAELDEARSRFNRAMDRADALMASWYQQETAWRDLFSTPQWTADELARFDTESGVKFQFSGHVTSADDATECELPYMDLLALVAEQAAEIAALKVQVATLTPKPEPVRNPMANALRFGAQNTGLRGL